MGTELVLVTVGDRNGAVPLTDRASSGYTG